MAALSETQNFDAVVFGFVLVLASRERSCVQLAYQLATLRHEVCIKDMFLAHPLSFSEEKSEEESRRIERSLPYKKNIIISEL